MKKAILICLAMSILALGCTGCMDKRSSKDKILMYRVRDLRVSVNFAQRIFGTGTVTVISSDKNTPNLELRNIRHPHEVKELIHQRVEETKKARRMHTMEVMGDDELEQDDIIS